MYHARAPPHIFTEFTVPSSPKSVVLLLLLLCACRGDQGPVTTADPVEESALAQVVEALEPVAEPPAEAVTTSAATPPEAAIIEAAVDLAWAAELTPGALNALIDVAALRAWAASIPSVTDADERVANLLAEAISDQAKRTLDLPGSPIVHLEPGATMLGISIGAAGFSVVSDRPMSAPDARAQALGERYRLSFGAQMETGESAPVDLDGEAFFVAWAPDFSGLPGGLSGSLDFLEGAGVEGFAIGVRPDGSVRASLSTEDPSSVGLAFGRGQAFASQAAGQLNQSARPEFQPFVTYFNRAVQSLFAILTIEQEPGIARLVVGAPRCGGAFRNLLAVAVLTTLADAAAADDRTAPREFVPMTGHFAEDCSGTIPGPPAGIPESLLAVGSADAGQQSFVIAVDLAGALREGLPTGFGLFPFALDAEMLVSVFGGRPLGMTGLDDVDAHWVFASERTAGSGAPAHRTVLFPSGMRSFLPPDSSIDTMRPIPMVEHVAFASPAIGLRERVGGDVAPHWSAGHARLPANAVAAAFLGAGLVQPWGDRLESSDAARTWLHQADGALVYLTPDGAGASLYGLTAPPSSDEVRELLPTLLAQISYNDRVPERADERAATVQLALEQMTIKTSPSSIDLLLEGDASLAIAAILRVSVPMIGNTTTRTVGLPQQLQLPR